MTDDIEIRPLHTHAECKACVTVQAGTWGGDPTGFTSAALLLATQHSGGVVSGAVTREGEVVGFVYSYVAHSEGRFYHWSHQLAVLPAYQSQGLARALKAHQRQLVLERGMNLIAWTFDPLMSVNAHFNLNRLGAVCGIYRRNAYGAMRDDINRGLESDRFDCHWWLDHPRVEVALTGQATTPTLGMWRKAGAVPLNTADALTTPSTVPRAAHALLVTIPTDFTAIKHADLRRAQAWQTSVRGCFEAAFAAGFAAQHFIRGPEYGHYVLLKGQT